MFILENINLTTVVVQRFISTIFYNCLYCLKQNRIRFEMIDFLLRLYTPKKKKKNGEKSIEEERSKESLKYTSMVRFTRYGIKPAQLQLLWQQFKAFSKYFRCTNSFWLVYPDTLRSLVVYVAAKISIDFRNNSVCVWEDYPHHILSLLYFFSFLSLFSLKKIPRRHKSVSTPSYRRYPRI